LAPVRLWAKVEYDGTDFFGFQVQAQGRTVQGEIERAIRAVTGTETRVVGAGRTDRGVHARGQVIVFDVVWRHTLQDLHRALNATLAADVAILEIGEAPEGFHPRFSAVRRAYRYRILNQPWPAPLERRTAWYVAQALDVDRMAQATRCLVGTHDFATFGRPPQGDNTVRSVFRAEWTWQRGQPLLTFDIEADAFLYRMVRSVVGMLVQVGQSRLSPEAFDQVFRARDRCLVRQVAPARGLTLLRVDYGTREGVK
jgi:tRNA pseudouridine38-40 synthase